MDARQQKTRLGVFVAVALISLVGLAIVFGGMPKWFVSSHEYFIVFRDAPGISVGTPVRRSGIKIGEVTKVELNDATGEVKVSINVQSKYTIRTTDEATISQDLLSRDTSIELVSQPPPSTLTPPAPLNPTPKNGIQKIGGIEGEGKVVTAIQPPLGKQPRPDQPPPLPQPPPVGDPLPPGSVIRGRPPLDTRGLLGQAGDIFPTVEGSLNAIRRSAERLELAIPQLQAGAVEFTELGKAIREAVPEVRRTNDELRLLLQSAREAAPGLRRTNEELQVTIRNLGGAAERIDNLIQVNQVKLVRALDQATDVLQRLSQVLSDENQKNLTATMRAVQAASVNFDSLVRNGDDFLREGTKTAKRFQDTLTQMDSVFVNLNQATKPLAERGDRILRNLDTSIEQISRALGGLGEVLGPIGRGDGTLQKFISDPSLYNNLNNAAFGVTRLLPKLEYILKDLETFADKIARHPESIGLGGAVRPSAGLKDGPSGIKPPH